MRKLRCIYVHLPMYSIDILHIAPSLKKERITVYFYVNTKTPDSTVFQVEIRRLPPYFHAVSLIRTSVFSFVLSYGTRSLQPLFHRLLRPLFANLFLWSNP